MKIYHNVAICLVSVATPLSAETTADPHVAAVRQIGEILAEYTQKTGGTPFAENWQIEDPKDDSSPVPIICNLSVHEIPDELAFPPFSCFLMPHEELEEYLSDGLGREIKLPLDDRDLKEGGRVLPLFYTIQINEGEFFVATYLTEVHQAARKLGDNFYKFEVGSVAVPARMIEEAAPPPQKKDGHDAAEESATENGSE